MKEPGTNPNNIPKGPAITQPQGVDNDGRLLVSPRTGRKMRKYKKKIKIEGFEEYKFKGYGQTIMKKKAVINGLGETLGHIGNACKQADISPRTHRKWRKEDTEYDRAFRDYSEYIVDEFEYLLKRQAYEKDTKAIIFYLKTKGKDRGYMEINKTINEHSGKINPVGINFILQSDPNYNEKKRGDKPTSSTDKEGKKEMRKSEVPNPEETNNPSQKAN